MICLPFLLVGSTAELPDYDRRFIGFGWNKVSHIYNLHKQGKLPMLYSLQRLSLLKFIYKIIVTGRHYIYNSFCKMTDTYLTPKDAQASVQIFILHNCTLLETIQNIWYYTCIFVNHCMFCNHVILQGYTFWVLPDVFIIHLPHTPSLGIVHSFSLDFK